MITYVNTVLVGTGNGAVVNSAANATTAGQYVVEKIDEEKFRVGLVTNKTYSFKGATKNVIKWSADIRINDVKSMTRSDWFKDTEDVVTINFNSSALVAGKRIVVRLTFKDLPTRFRKWTESYEHVVVAGKATASDVVDAFVKIINEKDAKRARVIASKSGSSLVLTAMPYTDDDTVDSISPANKIRFSANAWYTDPQANGIDYNNKYSAATITKTPGEHYTASAKLVRDMEAQAMGYDGILNRGEGTWPIVKPGMNVDLNAKYDSLTIEFENLYRTADDLQRRTKQTLQVFEKTTATNPINKATTGLIAKIAEIIGTAPVAVNNADEKHDDTNHAKA